VHGDGDFKELAPPLPAPLPDWSPVRSYGGYQARRRENAPGRHSFAALACGCANSCDVHGHAHARAWAANVPASDGKAFWGALGCSCWAFCTGMDGTSGPRLGRTGVLRETQRSPSVCATS